MTMAYLKLPLITALLALAGCSSTPPQPKLNQLHNEVGKLNKEMRQLTRQAGAVEQQGLLNSGSTQGAWLLPLANTAVILKSQAGDLTLSLGSVQAETNGTRAVLNIRVAGDKPLPAFSAEVEWGELDSATGKPLSISSQAQKIEVSSPLLPRSAVSIPLHLGNLSPGLLGYVRVHDVIAAPAETSPGSP